MRIDRHQVRARVAGLTETALTRVSMIPSIARIIGARLVRRARHFIRSDQLGYLSAALLVVPAAVVVALYPINSILGTVSFNFTSFPIGPVRPLFVVPLVIGSIVAVRRKSWMLAVLALPGAVLLLSAPDRLGAYTAEQASEVSYYPENYSSEEFLRRISLVDHFASDSSWLFALMGGGALTSDKARRLNDAAMDALKLWQQKVARNEAVATHESRITQLVAERGQLLKFGSCPTGLARAGCQARSLRKAADIQAQIDVVKRQVVMLKAGPSPDALYALAVDATVAAKVELQAIERLAIEQLSFAQAIPYIATASLSFFLLIYCTGFRSAALAVVLAGTVAVAAVSSLPLSLDDRLGDAILTLYPAYICVVSAFILRFLVRAYLDNREIEGWIDPLIKPATFRRHLRRSAALTVLLWLPFPLVVVGVVYLSNWFYSEVSDALYCRGRVSAFDHCSPHGTSWPLYDSDPSRDTLREDVNAATARLFAKLETEAARGASAMASNAAPQVAAAKAKVMQTFDRVLPPNLYEIFPELTPPPTSDCVGLIYFRPICFARKIALERINDAYRKPRNRLRRDLDHRLTEVGLGIIVGTKSGADSFKEAIAGESQAAAHRAARAVDATFVGFNVVGVAQMAFMLLVATRAYLLGLGRLLYRAPRPGGVAPTPAVPLVHMAGRLGSPARPEVWPEEFAIDRKFLPLIACRSYGADNAIQTTRVFKSLLHGWPLRRLRAGRFFLRNVTEIESTRRVRYTSGPGRQFVVWTVPPKGVVFFRWDRFVAMSDNMRFGRVITLRFGGLTLSTTMHACVRSADVEGLLVLESFGDVELSHEVDTPSAGSPTRWISWTPGAEFKIASSTRLSSLYIDTSDLDPKPNSIAALDADGGRSYGFGLLRELVVLLRP